MPTNIYQLLPSSAVLLENISRHYRIDEAELVQQLLIEAETETLQPEIKNLARKLIEKVRTNRQKASGVDALMHEFSLSSQEGIALMCLAEALLRIPDQATRDKLIKDKIAKGDWKSHIGNSPSLFVNASAWGLVFTGKLLSLNQQALSSSLNQLISKAGEPVIRKGIDFAMRLLGKQFVTGETIQLALKNSEARFNKGFRFTYDMLGESAFTEQDAQHYYQDYVNSIHAVGAASKGLGVYHSSGVSVKLSAIHPRYSLAQYDRVMDELYPRLRDLFLLAKRYNIGLNIDAEEANRLEISLDLIDRLLSEPELADFDGIGIVVQAYQKRCRSVIDYLIAKARENNRKLMIRLVKGAYWDSEVKLAQTESASGYPVFTRKVHTDLNYVACAKKLLAAQDVVFPQFATHNAQTLATIYHLAKGKRFEFQCLHGMGETLYDQVVGKENLNIQCRVYAPVGSYQTLLAYLVRRLLENGSNSSFVNQIVDENVSIDKLLEDPVAKAGITAGTMHPKTPLPINLFADRKNSAGYELSDMHHLVQLGAQLNALADHNQYRAVPQIAEQFYQGSQRKVIYNPADQTQIVGEVTYANETDVEKAFAIAEQNQTAWQATPAEQRAAILEKIADLMESNMPTLFDLAVREAGKTLNNAIAEVREAVDFCRYYANQVKRNPQAYQNPRGIIVAISPWNFPLAIFTGEVVSALVAGNVVLAKPAEQTSLMAHYAVELFYQAGVPKNVLQCLPGSGAEIGNKLTADPRVDGVIFTGSTETAKTINRNLQKHSKIVPLIAETGGQNALIMDSSALGEQVVADVLNSAFDSAGQRCSALRVLYLQEDVADHILTMLKGAMAELRVGKPQLLNTDVGPVIDRTAQNRLLAHIEKMKAVAKSYYQVPIAAEVEQNGIFVPPTLLEIDHISQIEHEVFGPVLHVIRFNANQFEQIIDDINSTGFGLTSGLHSRIDATIDQWLDKVHAGNLYVNRNTVGAVVGVQPFGGMGLSGTGPKAGGPLYLQRLVKSEAWTLADLEGETVIETDKLAQAVRQTLSGEQQSEALALLQTLRQKSPLAKVFKMQGITGENNYLRFEARPMIAVSNGSLLEQIKAMIAIVVCGSKAVIKKDSPLAEYAHQFTEYVTVADDFNRLPALSVMIVLEPLSAAERQHYAERNGAILTYVESLDLALSLLPLVHEKSVSINTAAAGGNATLMSEMD
ncbi:bifunctional proline dehydrogenase/L-glutamate gamma-semialdehyde dehydrogenase PutA [Actinobacillus pleuropneumoniae]|uniref:bifunctional proline dehydrogenase/L-glutamate gamma-semialdehyde dehydrogenase PutA n=1 Tax=Actinobacillus pleuropneumoniae TaxID=715 RepID=UPI001EECF602|nr:bifunctional proline dehydrogenase/L-glutamate gamma-semialdehyde dehydrogenase PutA [Actinobacillus pleuropneumoniae]UKH17656.1 bifunctional proline dehydrogenase/L-glutamate gamma-semialdehyde dehydrogenase PutA [Actinobacillus pleuropneumoniae]